MAITIYSGQVSGMNAQPISVEVDITPGLHIFSIVGLADKEVQESRERISAAIKNIGALAPHKKSQRVIVNLAPANIKKEGPAFDLPIALGYLLASGQLRFDPRGMIFLGELGLDGSLRHVPGALPIAMAAQVSGFKRIILPKGNGREAAILKGLEVYEMEHISDVVEHLSGQKEFKPLEETTINHKQGEYATDFKEIRGQEQAKRALEIAAAGGHNILMTGPPGTGKTLLAQTLPTILPDLSFDELLEVTKVYSIAGLLTSAQSFVSTRPFRNPHHTASYTSVIGGGRYPRPGEATLAHRGILFLDELPEFDRRVIESLRQPLEERVVSITRAEGSETFPAQFMLVAAMNPCPCGHKGNSVKDCVCSPGAITRYTKKVSGPLLDRIDLHIEVPAVEYEKLETHVDSTSSENIQKRVGAARHIQSQRFRDRAIHINSEMGLRDIKEFIRLTDPVRDILKTAHGRYKLSARAYHRILKLARTIADLEASVELTTDHVLEALQYRPKDEI